MMLKLKSAQMLRTSSTLRHFSNKYPKPGRPDNLDKKTDEEGYWKRGRVPDYSFEKPKGFLQQVSEFFSSWKQNSSEKKPKEFHNVESDPKIRYGSTLPKDLTAKTDCSWSTAGLDSFKKVKFEGNSMNLVAVDWLKSKQYLHDISSIPGGIVQSSLAQGLPEFFLVFNIQAPYSSNFHLVLYYMTKTPVSGLLQRFINGDDQFRNSSLVAYSHLHSYLAQRVLQDVGPFIVAEGLAIKYVHGKNYLEIEINGSSLKRAEFWASAAFGVLNYYVFDAAFVIQDNMRGEVPLVGTVRLNKLNTKKAVDVDALG